MIRLPLVDVTFRRSPTVAMILSALLSSASDTFAKEKTRAPHQRGDVGRRRCHDQGDHRDVAGLADDQSRLCRTTLL